MKCEIWFALVVTPPSDAPAAFSYRWPKPCTWIRRLHAYAGAIWKFRDALAAAVDVEPAGAAGACTEKATSCAPRGLPNVGDRSRTLTRKVTFVPSSNTWKRWMSNAPARKPPNVAYA